MKKITTLSLLFSLMVFFSRATTIIIKRQNGSERGFNDITEKHTKNKHILICKDPGYEAPKWMYKPKSKAYETLFPIVEKEILLGRFEGKVEYGAYTATWKGTGPYNLEVTFVDDEVE